MADVFIYSDALFDFLSGMNHEILFDILSDIHSMWHIHIYIYIHSVILSDILSGILSDIYFHILFGNLCCKYYDVLSDIVSGILSVLYSDFFLSDIGHSFRHSIWHIFWHVVCLTVFLAFKLRHSTWHLFWPSFWCMFGSICAQRDLELDRVRTRIDHSLRCARKSVRAHARRTAGDIVSGSVYFVTWAGTCCEVWDYWCPWWRQVGGRKRGEVVRMRRSRRRRNLGTLTCLAGAKLLHARLFSCVRMRSGVLHPANQAKRGIGIWLLKFIPPKKTNSHSQFVLHDVSWYLLNIFANARDRPF